MYQSAGASHLRQGGAGRPGSDRAAAQGTAAHAPVDRHDLSGLQPAGAAHRSEKRLLPAGDCRREEERRPKARRGAAGAGRPVRPRERLSVTALRRPEAARGHCPSPRHEAEVSAVRRGHQCARPHDHTVHSRAAQADQPDARRDHCGHHARDARDRTDLRPRRSHRPEPDRGDRQGQRGVREPAVRHCQSAYHSE